MDYFRLYRKVIGIEEKSSERLIIFSTEADLWRRVLVALSALTVSPLHTSSCAQGITYPVGDGVGGPRTI